MTKQSKSTKGVAKKKATPTAKVAKTYKIVANQDFSVNINGVSASGMQGKQIEVSEAIYSHLKNNGKLAEG